MRILFHNTKLFYLSFIKSFVKIKLLLKFLFKIRKDFLLQNLLISSFHISASVIFKLPSIKSITPTNVVSRTSLFRQSGQVTGRLRKLQATLLSMQIRENNPICLSDTTRTHADANTSQRDKMQRDEQSSDIHGIVFKNDMNSTWALDGGFPDLYNGPSEARRAVTFDYK